MTRVDNTGAIIDEKELPDVQRFLAAHRCPLETEMGVFPTVKRCGLPAAPGHTWCREHLVEYGITEPD